MANDWQMFAGDMYPPMPVVLDDSNGPIDLTNASSVSLVAKGKTNTLTGTRTILQTSFTGDITQGSNQILNASSTTGLWVPGTEPWPSGSTLYSEGNLPAPTGSVGNWSLPTITAISGTTITMSQNALVTQTGVTIIANMGTAWYVWLSGDSSNPDTYSGVDQITWASGSKVQTVPNEPSNEWTLTISAVP